jgi:ribonuclease G
MPYSDQSGISRKIDDPKERDRLRKILQSLTIPEGMGVIMRTVGEGQRARYFVRDLAILVEQWQAIEEGFQTKAAPAVLFQEPDLIERTVRDFLTDEIDEIICDSVHEVERMKQVVGQISSRAKRRILPYKGEAPIFEHFNVERQIDNAFHRQVWLPCGGYIVVDETEALIAIDVNTGRNRGQKDVEKTILQTNLEAAAEITRQLRLRNIGGLVICDFIDMKHPKDRMAVFNAMKDHLRRDKAKTHVLPISPFGLMEMTRQRAHESISSSVYEMCKYCGGKGRVKTTETVSVELQRDLNETLRRFGNSIHELRVKVSAELLQRLRTIDEEHLVEIERRHAGRLTFVTDPTFHQEQYMILNAKSGEEIRL